MATTLSAGTGPLAVSASVQAIGTDVLVAVWGGTGPHIGSVAISAPHPERAPEQQRSTTLFEFTFPGHRDDALARRVSMRVAAALQRTVMASAGFHIPDITAAGIETVLANTDELIEKIITALQEGMP